jgi:hypothetical protein
MKSPTDLVEVQWVGRNGLVCESKQCQRRDWFIEASSMRRAYHAIVGGSAKMKELPKKKKAVQHHYEIVR